MGMRDAMVWLACAILLLARADAVVAQPEESGSESDTAPLVSGNLVIAGSSTMAPLIGELARRYQQAKPGVDITVEAGGSGRGIADALSGKADIGMASRALKPEERAALFAITIARDAVAFIVHRANPVRAMTREQTRRIYTGALTNWQSLGGRDAPIRVVTRSLGHSSLEIVAEYCDLKPEDIKGQIVAGDNTEALQAVRDDPNAIAFLSLGASIDFIQRGMPVALLTIDGVPATVTALRSGRYPLARTLNLVTKRVPAGAALDFIRYVQAPAEQAVIEEYDFVPYE